MQHTEAGKYIFTGHKCVYYLTHTIRLGPLDHP